MVDSLKEKLSLSLQETVGIARKLIALRDPYTAGHENHVGEFAKAIAAEMGFDEDFQEELLLGGYLHDIGKIVVPVSILTKPGRISSEEYGLIQNHVQAGFDLLKDISFPWDVSRTVLEHHERLDGSGYPNQLKADEISMQARILAIADVVLSMAAARPYRQALGIEAALAEIERGRNLQYDSSAVDACINLIRQKGYQLPGNLD